MTEPVLGKRAANKHRVHGDIVAASLALFAEVGYDAATTEQIARRVGISQRTFFRYFPKKEQIMDATAFNYLAPFEAALEAAVAEKGGGLDAVESAFLAQAHWWDARAEEARAVFALLEQSPALQSIDRTKQYGMETLTARALESRRGVFAPGPPGLPGLLAAAIVIAAQRPLLRSWFRHELSGALSDYAVAGWAELRPFARQALRYAGGIGDLIGASRTD